MSRKDCILIAAAIKRQTDKPDALDRSIHEIASDLSEVLKRDNPNFVRSHFMEACGF